MRGARGEILNRHDWWGLKRKEWEVCGIGGVWSGYGSVVNVLMYRDEGPRGGAEHLARIHGTEEDKVHIYWHEIDQ